MGNNVAELFHVLVDDVESFKKERHSFKINYSLLGKGNLCETRFVIGKIIMDTMGCGGVQRGEVNQEEKDELHTVDPEQRADVFEENSHRAADLEKRPTLGKDDRGCSIPPSNCELKQESSEKQKLTGKRSKFSEERMPKNQEAIANKEPEEKAEKRKGLIDINKCLELAKKHQNSITKCHLGQENRIEQREGVLENKECHLDQHGVVTKKNINPEKEEINTVGSRLRLSSLFK
ncbi:unnamed protein product [Ilex paraguariensis]|uniref:Uncharacterized protein n=1 Tax=Ilex paraguariensis TaxID=185542 RepID=A0ABC8TCL1_9AQUA